jgi:hypothetical protein
MKYLEATLIFLSVALVGGAMWFLSRTVDHQCPLPSRPEIQLMLRVYDPNLVIDGYIGSKGNEAWRKAEDADTEKKWVSRYERGMK